MAEVREQLLSIEKKYKLFKQQQFTFMTALERSREHARDKTEPVSTIAQVQRYMNIHCSNSTDRRIFLLFLEIISDLGGVLKHLESSRSSQNNSCKSLDTCRELLGPNSNISQLRAHYPHNEVNRLSCDEARNFYGGIISVIPLALDLLTTYSKGAQRLTPTATETSQQTVAKNAGMVKKIKLSSQNNSCESLDTCRELLGPNSNISQLRAHYPHNEINLLSCDEARNFYGGIVSVIPLALNFHTTYSKGAQPLTPTATETSQQTVAKNAGMVADLDKDTSENPSRYKKGKGGFHAGKPAWKPPGKKRG